jgi:hypothetical protein
MTGMKDLGVGSSKLIETGFVNSADIKEYFSELS